MKLSAGIITCCLVFPSAVVWAKYVEGQVNDPVQVVIHEVICLTFKC